MGGSGPVWPRGHEKVQVKSGYTIGREIRHIGNDGRSPIATLNAISMVPEAFHQ